MGEGGIHSPHIHPHPEPVEGRGCADLVRVIARRIAPKQPRGSSTLVRVSLLGCFAALAMTQIYCRRRVPREGGDPVGQLASERRGLDPRLRGENG